MHRALHAGQTPHPFLAGEGYQDEFDSLNTRSDTHSSEAGGAAPASLSTKAKAKSGIGRRGSSGLSVGR